VGRRVREAGDPVDLLFLLMVCQIELDCPVSPGEMAEGRGTSQQKANSYFPTRGVNLPKMPPVLASDYDAVSVGL
jgi:hypothetical protein